jgi:hypothetical protein|tara:strand:- start:986 stop:1411 length:426 start_codon:yes stop_codon:yes gene_type:complete
MSNLTDVYFNKEDLGKNLYRKKTYYTLCIEQDVLAKNQDEADTKFSDDGGIDHSKITKDITDAKNGVETYMVDANYSDSANTEFIGKVMYEDDEYAKEDGMVEINTYALEDDPVEEPKSDAEIESDIDVAINLENESKLGK